ncbi:hypothetical protein BB561_006717 [Smittium simulii]|uniref:Uncharacterized protein n=1 Tax=Smittium simulii TaxID=133385 RepID=A0A2T9Y233_9FUNG|nr:hypothetical protein BB561_006717 [Smittium simulii]
MHFKYIVYIYTGLVFLKKVFAESKYEYCVRTQSKGNPYFYNSDGSKCACDNNGEVKCGEKNNGLVLWHDCLKKNNAVNGDFYNQGNFKCTCTDKGAVICENLYERCIRVEGKSRINFKNQKGEKCICLQNGQTQCGADIGNTKSPKEKCLADAGVKINPFVRDGYSYTCLDDGTKKRETEYERCVRVNGRGNPTFTNPLGKKCMCLQTGQTRCMYNN